MEKIISDETLLSWVRELREYTLFTPFKEEEQWVFRPLKHAGLLEPDFCLDFLNCVPSPKGIVFPQREVLFGFSEDDEKGNGLELHETLPGVKPQIIFGIRPCDARAISLMDKVFEDDIKDPYYLRRREQTFFVGLGCLFPPSVNCFCTAVGGSPFAHAGLDVLLTPLEGYKNYYLEVLTSKGETLAQNILARCEEPGDNEKSEREQIQAQAEARLKREIGEEGLLESLEENFESPLWEEAAMSCIRCGICTYLCPSCHCFDMEDEVDRVSPPAGKRVRVWDNCQFPDFTMHSSGHNPRPTKGSRLRRRLLHKFLYFTKTYGAYQCTGCGRCITRCPVGIDIIDILNTFNHTKQENNERVKN